MLVRTIDFLTLCNRSCTPKGIAQIWDTPNKRMLAIRKAEKQWKRSVEDALMPAKLGIERGRLAADVAKRIWVANGGQPWADSTSEGTLLALETLIGTSLDEHLVRSSAALRYLQALEDTLKAADYEDAPELRRELRWTGKHFKALLPGLGIAPKSSAEASVLTGAHAVELEHLQDALCKRLSATLKAAEIAA